jgi:hypothetical protein
MKKLMIYLFLAIILSLPGCSDLIGDGDVGLNVNWGTARVIIPLPNGNQARSVGLSNVKTYTDYFEVVFRNNSTSTLYFATASLSDGYIEISIPDGNYDILLFGGDKDYYLNYSPLLLASSYAQNINITLDETNMVDMPLETFDVDITLPSKVIVGNNYSINIRIETKNPLINSFWNGGLMSDQYYNGGDVDVSIDNGDFTKNGNVYTFTKLFSAPLSPSNKQFNLFGYIKMFDSSQASTWSYGTTAHPNLGQNYSVSVSFVNGADVGLNIYWPE